MLPSREPAGDDIRPNPVRALGTGRMLWSGTDGESASGVAVMVGDDPLKTQRDIHCDPGDELASEGYDEVRLIGQGGFGLVYK